MSDHEVKGSKMYERPSKDTIVCRDCGQTKPLDDAECTATINEIVIWHCGDCTRAKKD